MFSFAKNCQLVSTISVPVFKGIPSCLGFGLQVLVIWGGGDTIAVLISWIFGRIVRDQLHRSSLNWPGGI